MGTGLPYCEWRNWVEKGVGSCPLVLHPQSNAPPRAEPGTAKRGFTSTLWPATASLTLPWQPGTHPPFAWSHLVTVIPAQPAPQCTHRAPNPKSPLGPGAHWGARHGDGAKMGLTSRRPVGSHILLPATVGDGRTVKRIC